MADYIQINDNNNIYHEFIYDCNHDNNYRKDLCILTNLNNNHYNLLFDKKYNCFKNNENKLIFLNNLANKKEILSNNHSSLHKKTNENIESENNVNKLNSVANTYNIFNNKDNKVINYNEDDNKDYIENDSEESDLEYNNDKWYKLDYENILLKCKDKSTNEIIKLYDASDKKTKYSDIYRYLLSKLEDKSKANWPEYINIIKDKNKKKS